MCSNRKETAQLPDLSESPRGISSGPTAKIVVHLDEQKTVVCSTLRFWLAGSGGEERGGRGEAGGGAGKQRCSWSENGK